MQKLIWVNNFPTRYPQTVAVSHLALAETVPVGCRYALQLASRAAGWALPEGFHSTGVPNSHDLTYSRYWTHSARPSAPSDLSTVWLQGGSWMHARKTSLNVRKLPYIPLNGPYIKKYVPGNAKYALSGSQVCPAFSSPAMDRHVISTVARSR